jgi:predicted YcjX-like family ATPase
VADADPRVSEIRLALRFRSNESLMRHFKDTSTLYLEIVDYPGEWLLDLPMLAQDYLSWSRQMTVCYRVTARSGRRNGGSCAKG